MSVGAGSDLGSERWPVHDRHNRVGNGLHIADRGEAPGFAVGNEIGRATARV